jgi:hypothetical protein
MPIEVLHLHVSSKMPLLLKLFAPVLRKSRLGAGALLEFSGIGK